MEKVILFGASTLGKAAYEILKYQYDIVVFCDNDKEKWGTLFCNILVVSPEKLEQQYYNKIIITSIYHESIARQLCDKGINEYEIFTYSVKSVNNEGYDEVYSNISYSQDGEDMILKSLFEGIKDGFYVDIGAHHPVRFSNTLVFYKMGWNGINIEPAIGSKNIFDRLRPRDINLEIGISENEGELDYYIFDEPGLNSFNKDLSINREETTTYELLEIKKINVYSLKKIFEKYLNRIIDFMSIDVEGLELDVLKSNDWKEYRPKILLIEDLNFDFSNVSKNELYNFIIKNGYELIGRANRTVFYKDSLK
ncbi:FkbM family methyltransferase [Clostridium sp. JS66]|uniref:FkbM family methyltransferase n=1 Tax=Clostridium sp. JS66 TaxID=3064705 RepID=UPI00298E1050|nr:FkbM family methyltransferase [Clostridium sp. JS66]WPC41028.1 FkbM family methyltransferase [Clostridium sp. JS66]